jgi:hypothetical protein
MTAALALVCMLTAAADEPVKPAVPPKPAMIVDVLWKPKPGDKAIIGMTDTPGAMNMYVWGLIAKLIRASDTTGMNPFYAAKSVVKLPQGVEVLVIERHNYQPMPTVTVLSGAESFATFAQESVGRGMRPEPPENVLELRILSGEFEGRALVVPEKNVVQMIPAPFVPPPKPKPAPKKVDPAERAATLLKTARNLEKLGKTAAALETYRRLVDHFSGTAAAKEAAERIKAVGK